ncbi:MAG TPA: HEAT repeat domain-containing protein, partial [Gemmatimonadales bacterium]
MILSRPSLIALAVLTLAAPSLRSAPLGAQGAAPPTLDQLIRAEDARGRTPSELAVLRAGARAPDTDVRRFAVRGLGRLERADVLDDLVAALADRHAGVRRA